MGRLIDADALIAQMEADAEQMEEPIAKMFTYAAINDLKHAPTIEPERKKGKWIDNHTTCSECGWQMIDDVTQTPNMVGFNYCPNCGTKMEEGEQ